MKTISLQLRILSLILFFIPVLTHAQSSVIWTGANLTTDWNDPGNWDSGNLPDVLDDVIISNAADSMPVFLDTAQIASLIIQQQARLTIDTFAKLQIVATVNNAVLCRGLLDNHGHIQIAAMERGIGPTAGVGVINNYGILSVHAIHQEAIAYHYLQNSYAGLVQVSSNLSDGIVITNSLFNHGRIVVDSAFQTGLKTTGVNIRNRCAGIISISNCKIGLHAVGEFENNSTIKIQHVSRGIIHERLNNDGFFRNKDERLVFMTNVSDTALRAARFENKGYLEIHADTGALGIHIKDASDLNSPGKGQINMHGGFENTLVVDSGGVFFATQYSEQPFFQDKLNWNYNRNEYHREIDGEPRNFLIHVPEIYDSTEAVPLLFMLHGGSGDGTKFYNISGWKEKADIENFISVYPSALRYVLAEHLECTTRWNDDALLGKSIPGVPIKDDVLFMRELISLCRETFNIDTSRIYFCGFSNGAGFIRTKVLPEMTDVVTATAGAGSFGLSALEYPLDSIYLPHWGLFGTRDPKLLQNTGLSEFPIQGDSLLAIPQVLSRVENITTSLQIGMSYTEDPNPPLYNTLEFTDDLSGQGNEYKLTIVKNLEHQFANGTNHPLVYADLLWPWFIQWER